MIDANAIQNPEVRNYYFIALPLRQIIRDFYALLPEEHYEARLVDQPTRKSDSPRESLIHILKTELAYFKAIQTGTLDFETPDASAYRAMAPAALLTELDTLDEAVFNYVADSKFNSEATVTVPWGTLRAVDVLYLIRDHDLLHIGWNLAIMDHVGMERFPSLKAYWG